MWTYVVSTKSDEKVPDLVSSVKPDPPGDEKLKEVKKFVESSEKNAHLVRSVAPQAVKTEAVVNNPQAFVRHNGALLAAGSVSSKKTHVRQKGSNKQSKGKAGKTFQYTEQSKLFNSAGFPPPFHIPDNNAVFRVMQSYETTGFHISSASVATFSAAQFQIGFLDQISPLTSVFDQYRIALVEVWLTPRVNTVGQSSGNNAGLFHSVIDYDDATALSTVAQANDYANVMVSSGCVGHYRRFKPHIAMAAYSGVFTSFANVTSPWIDAASATVSHYGLKTAWTSADSTYVYDLVVRLHTEWRNVR